MANYPNGFPLAETQSLAAVIRSGQLTTRNGIQQATQDGWWVAGFCLSLYPGVPQPVINGPVPVGSIAPMLDQESTAALLDLRAAFAEAPKTSMAPPDESDPEVAGSMLTKFWHEVIYPLIHKLLEALFGPIDNGPN